MADNVLELMTDTKSQAQESKRTLNRAILKTSTPSHSRSTENQRKRENLERNKREEKYFTYTGTNIRIKSDFFLKQCRQARKKKSTNLEFCVQQNYASK